MAQSWKHKIKRPKWPLQQHIPDTTPTLCQKTTYFMSIHYMCHINEVLAHESKQRMVWSCTLSCHEPKWCIPNTNGIKTSSIAQVVTESLGKHHQSGQWPQNVDQNRQEQPFRGRAAPLTEMVVMAANGWWLMWHQMSTKCHKLRPNLGKAHQ